MKTNETNQKKPLALITGGATGIGRALTELLYSEGYNVILHFHSSQKKAQQLVDNGIVLDSYKADLTIKKNVYAMAAYIKEKWGRLDCLINNAGWSTYVPFSEKETIDDVLFDTLVHTNLKTVLYCSEAFLPLLKGKEKPCIINMASLSGLTGAGSNIVYSAAKAGVIALTKEYARNCSPDIYVYAIAPGYTETNFISWMSDDMRQEKMQHIKTKRFTKPEEIARITYECCLNRRVESGSVIVIDGGEILNQEIVV